jgi:Uma2 family endonuclease
MESTLEVSPELAYELERGKPMPSKNHSKLELRLSLQLAQAYEGTYEIYPELSLELPTGRFTPDVCLFPHEAGPSDWLEDEIRVTEVPLGIIEILSPRQALQDVIDKLDDYFSAGVQSCWLVVPNFRTIHVFSSKQSYRTFTEGTLRDEALGIELTLSELFR